MRLPDDLWAKVLRSMPIPCVDLLVTDPEGRVLLVRRRNEPAAGAFWFPGGRVLLGEPREAAAHRKLAEECGLRAISARELGTFDLVLPLSGGGVSHAVTTVFHVTTSGGPVRLDDQSSESAWRPAAEWIGGGQHAFITRILDEHARAPR